MPKIHVPLAVMMRYPALSGCGAAETLTDEMMINGEEPLGTTAQALVRTNRTFARKSSPINGDNTTRREHCLVENGQFESESVSVSADCLLDASDDSDSTSSTSFMLSGSTTTYDSTGVACPRWIGDIRWSTNVSPMLYTMTAGARLDSCEVGAHAHVDIYRLNADNAWKRIGGGRVQYEDVNGSCVEKEKGWSGGGQLDEPPWDWRPSSDELGSGTYRAVVRATRASGAPAKAYFRIISL